MSEDMLSRNIFTLKEFEKEISKYFDMSKISKYTNVRQESDESPSSIEIMYYYDTGRESFLRHTHIGTFEADFDDVDLSNMIGANWIFSKKQISSMSDNTVEFK